MAERPRINPDDLDRRVTDLGQYKKSRERAQRKAPAKPRAGGFLGSNPKAPLILAIVAVVLAALYVVPLFL